jgi:RNA 2',3'-cyclic 3'-phosphodiesterase
MNAEQSAGERPKKIRAFIALKTPAAWDAALGELQNELKGKVRSKAFKWTKPEQIHITLRFFGYLLPERVEAVSKRMGEVVRGHAVFGLRCEGLGCFPSSRRPRVLWVGIAGDTVALETLQASVTVATRNFGEPPEDRTFKAHLTLARIQQAERSAIEGLEKAIERGFAIEAEWRVKELILMQSHLSPQGARYERVASWPLI